MSWTELGALGEVLGAFAVVVSLVYLSRQIRQNTRAVRTGNATTVQGNFHRLAHVFYDRELGELIMRAMNGDSTLTPSERLAAFAFFFDMLKTAELAHHQFLRGELDASLWEASLGFYRAYFDTPGFRAYWKERQSAFVPDFRAAMEAWLSSPGALTRPTKVVGFEQHLSDDGQ